MSGGLGQGGIPVGKIGVRITSLEMLTRPARSSLVLPPDLRIERAFRPTVPFYRFLYNTVGEDWLWSERRRWSDEAVAATVQSLDVEVWVLSVDGQPAGYAELDRRVPGTVELVYFGLMPAFVGQGLGPPLLRFAIERAWATRPTRLWVHTCTLDHPAALGVYQRAGFVVYATKEEVIDDPRIGGLIRADAAKHIPTSFSSII